MSRKVFVGVSVVVMSTLACLAGTPQGEEEGQPGISPIPEAPTESSPGRAPATATGNVQGEQTRSEEGVCQGNRWRIIPLAVYEYPQGDGWKLVVIPLAVENGSELWGSFVSPISYSGFNLTTEEGYSYGPYTGSFLWLQPEPPSPYTAYVEGAKQTGVGVVHSRIFVLDEVPPGFRVRGANVLGSGGPYGLYQRYWGNPDSWSQVIFQVAESQHQYTLSIQGASVRCALAGGGWDTEILHPNVFKLPSEVESLSFPADGVADSVSQDLFSPFELAGARLQITSVYRDDTWFGDQSGDMLVIEFQVENMSGGYEASGEIRSYLVGDDGLIRTPGCESGWVCRPSWASLDFPAHNGFFQVGPSQTGVATIGFVAPRSVGNLKFVISDERQGVYQVFDLPDDL